MKPAARVTDLTDHTGQLEKPGDTTVTIGGLDAAVETTTMHTCTLPANPPHSKSPITKGSSSVTIGGRGAARMGDKVGCGAAITSGDTSVLIGD